MAMGIKNAAWVLCSKSIGSRPKKVVNEVSTMGRNRSSPACTTACSTGSPSRLRLAMRSSSTRLSLTTTPEQARKPINDISPTEWPSTR